MVSKTQNILKKEEVQEAGSILRICNSVDDSFFTKVIQISKRILLETKRLTNTINEDEIIEAAKKLVDLVKNHLSNVAQDQLTIGDRFMIESSNKLRTNILKFIDAVRSNQANPYDYLAKQEVEVASKEVVAAIKQVLTAAEAYEGEGEDGEQEEEEIPQPQQTQSSTTPYDIAEDVKKAKTLLQNVINANRNESQFGGFCKEFILQVNQLISISSKLQTNMEEPLKQATFSLVNAAKVAIGNPSDKVLIKQLDKAKQEMNDAIKSFLFACNKQSRLRRSSWKMVMESDEPVSEEDKVKKDVALRLIGILGDHFRTFKADWQGMKPELQDIVLKRMIEEFKPLGEGIKSSAENSSINEENEAMRELKRIMTMSNSNDLMAISKELKTFTKKIDKQVKQTTIGSNIMKTMSATQAVEKNLTELLIMCSDSVGDEHDRMLTTSVSNFLDALGTILSQTKLAAGIVTRRKSALKNRGTTPTLPESGDDKIRALLDTALQEVIATVNNFPKGKPEQNVISFITEGQNAAVDNYLSIKMKVEETIWSLIEDDTLSFKNTLTQLITTVASMLGNDVKRKDLKVILQLASLSKSIVSVISTILTSVSTYHYLKTTKSLLVAQQSSTKLLEMASPKGRNRTGSVWDDKSQGVFSQSNEYLGGSLDQIIRHVTTIQDTNFVKSFIMTYQSFTSAWVVLDKLMQRYEGPPTKIDDTELLKIKLRVCVVLKYWIENQFHDFDDNLIKKLMTFIMDTIRHDPQTQMAEMAKRLQSEMMKRIDEKNKEKKSLFETTPTIKTPDSGNSPAEMFMSFGDLEIAKQLTLRDFKVYAKVQPSELLNQAWTSPKLKHRSPNVISLISRTNKLSFGIASLILWNTTILDRAKCIEKMIKIAQFLREMNNFNTLLSIIAGLNTSAISRLKSTWEAVPKPLRDSLAKLQNIFDPSNSYKNYRAGRNEATSKGPTMPYIGTTLSDLTFAEDGNPDCLQDNTTLINFSKRELICKIIMDFLHNQHPPYNIATSEPIFTFVEELPSLEEKVLYELSLVREPRVQQQTK